MSNDMHGGDIYSCTHTQDLLDFSANISPLGLPNSVKSALTASIDHWDRYPDPHCRELRTALANKNKVSERWICCGNGAADLIYKIAKELKPRCAMVTAPTFSEYRKALSSEKCVVIDYLLDEKNEFNISEEITAILKKPLDLLVLCNPNNPTGQPIDPQLLNNIIEKCKQNKIWVLLDECFIPFLKDAHMHSKIGLLERFPNLIILRAFTKVYAMAGLRLGYLLCSNETLVRTIASCGQPWSVSTPAQIAGIAALKDTEYVDALHSIIQTERDYLIYSFKKIGVHVIGSHANYIFFKCITKDLKQKLLSKNILIRSCSNYHGLNEQFYRIAVRSHNENERLIAALTTIRMGEDYV